MEELEDSIDKANVDLCTKSSMTQPKGRHSSSLELRISEMKEYPKFVYKSEF